MGRQEPVLDWTFLSQPELLMTAAAETGCHTNSGHAERICPWSCIASREIGSTKVMIILHGACSGIKGMPRHGSPSIFGANASTALATTCSSHSAQSAAQCLPTTLRSNISAPTTRFLPLESNKMSAAFQHTLLWIAAIQWKKHSHRQHPLVILAQNCLPCPTCLCFIIEDRLPQGYQLQMQQCSRYRVLQCYCVWSRSALATSVPSTEDSCTNCYTFSAGTMSDWTLYTEKSRQLCMHSLYTIEWACAAATGAEMSLWNGTTKC